MATPQRASWVERSVWQGHRFQKKSAEACLTLPKHVGIISPAQFRAWKQIVNRSSLLHLLLRNVSAAKLWTVEQHVINMAAREIQMDDAWWSAWRQLEEQLWTLAPQQRALVAQVETELNRLIDAAEASHD